MACGLPSHGSGLPGRTAQANPRSGSPGPRCSQLLRRQARRAVGGVQRVGVARQRRAVRRAVVRQQAVEAHQRAGLHRQRDRAGRRAARASSSRRCMRTLSPSRTKRLRSGPRWPPGSTHRQPLSRVASSSANQNAVTLTGSVSEKVASWCQPTSPPMPGCLKMYIDCHSSGSARPSSRASASSRGPREKRSNTGSRSCSAWPILLIDSALACAQAAVGLEGLLLEEAAHAFGRGEEVGVGDPRLLAGREDAALVAGIEGLDDGECTIAHRGDLRRRLEALEDEVAAFAVVLDPLPVEHGRTRVSRASRAQSPVAVVAGGASTRRKALSAAPWKMLAWVSSGIGW